MDHSVRSYLERIPIAKLNTLLENDAFENTYAINDAILQDILEVLISRNAEPGSHLLPSIEKIQKLQTNRKTTTDKPLSEL